MDTNPTGSRTNRLFSTRKTKENSSVIKETLKVFVVKFLGSKTQKNLHYISVILLSPTRGAVEYNK